MCEQLFAAGTTGKILLHRKWHSQLSGCVSRGSESSLTLGVLRDVMSGGGPRAASGRATPQRQSTDSSNTLSLSRAHTSHFMHAAASHPDQHVWLSQSCSSHCWLFTLISWSQLWNFFFFGFYWRFKLISSPVPPPTGLKCGSGE